MQTIILITPFDFDIVAAILKSNLNYQLHQNEYNLLTLEGDSRVYLNLLNEYEDPTSRFDESTHSFYTLDYSNTADIVAILSPIVNSVELFVDDDHGQVSTLEDFLAGLLSA